MEALAGIIRSSVETKGSPWEWSNMSRWIPSERTQRGGRTEWATSRTVHVLRRYVARYQVRSRDRQLCAEGIAPALRVGIWGRNDEVRNNGAGGSRSIHQMWSLWQCSNMREIFLAYCFQFSSTVLQFSSFLIWLDVPISHHLDQHKGICLLCKKKKSAGWKASKVPVSWSNSGYTFLEGVKEASSPAKRKLQTLSENTVLLTQLLLTGPSTAFMGLRILAESFNDRLRATQIVATACSSAKTAPLRREDNNVNQYRFDRLSC